MNCGGLTADFYPCLAAPCSSASSDSWMRVSRFRTRDSVKSALPARVIWSWYSRRASSRIRLSSVDRISSSLINTSRSLGDMRAAQKWNQYTPGTRPSKKYYDNNSSNIVLSHFCRQKNALRQTFWKPVALYGRNGRCRWHVGFIMLFWTAAWRRCFT